MTHPILAALELQINSKSIAARETKELRTYILPFHFTVNEYCENSNKKVMGHYSTPNLGQDMEFSHVEEYALGLILYFIKKLSLTCRRSRTWTARLSWMLRSSK
jgi:hypothetical protein